MKKNKGKACVDTCTSGQNNKEITRHLLLTPQTAASHATCPAYYECCVVQIQVNTGGFYHSVYRRRLKITTGYLICCMAG